MSQQFEAEAPFDKMHVAIALLVQAEPDADKAISIIQEVIDDAVKKAEEPLVLAIEALENQLVECNAHLRICERLADGNLKSCQLKMKDRCDAVNSVEALVNKYLGLKDAAQNLVSEASFIAARCDGNTNGLEQALRIIGRLI